MEKVTLFSHILPEEQERMRVCFQMREFKNLSEEGVLFREGKNIRILL